MNRACGRVRARAGPSSAARACAPWVPRRVDFRFPGHRRRVGRLPAPLRAGCRVVTCFPRSSIPVGLLSGMFAMAATLLAIRVAATVADPPPPGWVGVYHAAGGTVKDGRDTSAFDVGSWGVVAPVNAPEDGGMAFKDDLEFHCHTKDINQLYLLGPARTQ